MLKLIIFDYIKIKSLTDLKNHLTNILTNTKPIICEIILPEKEQILPSSSAKQNDEGKIVSQPLENMFPFLSDDEFDKRNDNKTNNMKKALLMTCEGYKDY